MPGIFFLDDIADYTLCLGLSCAIKYVLVLAGILELSLAVAGTVRRRKEGGRGRLGPAVIASHAALPSWHTRSGTAMACVDGAYYHADGTFWHAANNGTLVADDAGAMREDKDRAKALEGRWPFPGELLDG